MREWQKRGSFRRERELWRRRGREAVKVQREWQRVERDRDNELRERAEREQVTDRESWEKDWRERERGEEERERERAVPDLSGVRWTPLVGQLLGSWSDEADTAGGHLGYYCVTIKWEKISQKLGYKKWKI